MSGSSIFLHPIPHIASPAVYFPHRISVPHSITAALAYVSTSIRACKVKTMADSRNNSSDSNTKDDTSDSQSPTSSPIQGSFQKVWKTIKKAADPRTERGFPVPSFLRRDSSITPSASPSRRGSSGTTSPEQSPPRARQPEDNRSSATPPARPQPRRTFSVPEFLRRGSTQSESTPEEETRPEEVEAWKFGHTLIGLMGRHERYRYLLCPRTLAKIDEEVAEEKIKKAKEGLKRNSI